MARVKSGSESLKDGYRQKAFVMTKVDGRAKEAASRQLDQSLQRLQVDHVDLLQHHEVLRFTFLAAKRNGKIRYIGFTGHKDPHVHLYMLEVAASHGFHFDTVQMPLNVMDAHFRSFAGLVVPKAVDQGIAVTP